MSKLSIISVLAVSSVLLFAQSVLSDTSPESTAKDINPYVLPGFNKEEVLKLKNEKRTFKNCWTDPKSYEVCLIQTPTHEYLFWDNEKIPFYVTTKTYRSGSKIQTWRFENGRIHLVRGWKGKVVQTWELPNTTWKYTKLPNGEVNEEWECEKDEDALKHYKSVIDSWCAENYYFMGKENCVIY